MARNYSVCSMPCSFNRDSANFHAKAAVAALNTLQTNFAVIEAFKKSGQDRNKFAIPEMLDWCGKAGYEVGERRRWSCSNEKHAINKDIAT